jgi:catechol 2,3-dioxygenase-like lactoylglutathione lyase family enzyme
MRDDERRPTTGLHHAGLTVPDLAAARGFFTAGLGFEVVGEKPDYPAVFVSDGTVMITLWQAVDPAHALPFDRHNSIGLHHLALQVRSADHLESLHRRLATRDDVAIEFAPEPLNGGPTRHMMCRAPGGIRLEFIAPAQA